MKPTQEQLDVIQAVYSTANKDKIIAVNACAGSGKSSVSRMCVQTYKPQNGFYTAFNRAIVEDSKNKMGNLIQCSTIHSLAYKYANSGRRGIKELTYRDINEPELTVKEKIEIINSFDTFCRSKYENLDDFLEAHPTEVSPELILKYADMMLEGKLSPTFSFLLKRFHLLLLDNIVHPTFDLFIVDECQDLSEVMLEILKLIDADKKLILGDRYQNIYSFMNTVNAFDELDPNILEVHHLTKSFRCRPEIAERVEFYGKQGLTSDYRFRGNEDLEIGKYNPRNVTYLCKLNSSLLQKINECIHRDISFSLIRSVKDIFEFPLAMECASKGKDVFSTKYKYLQDFYKRHKFKGPNDYLNTIAFSDDFDEQTVNMAKLISDFNTKGINLWSLREKVRDMIPDPNYTLSTIHAYKGLEADNVVIDGDICSQISKMLSQLDKPIELARKTMEDKEKETLNLMYVAKSRARYTLKEMKVA